ncbi:GM12132 [Drosophila sechellia]|uniref:GM12132 n=1 Tax=Drosophila sechellia TaxID=7238 RepID=B4HZV0_DROSE|nr:GM12132 [Drosophila sechellia]
MAAIQPSMSTSMAMDHDARSTAVFMPMAMAVFALGCRNRSGRICGGRTSTDHAFQ